MSEQVKNQTVWHLNRILQKLLYGHISPISLTIQIKRVWYCRGSKGELISDILLWTPKHRHSLDSYTWQPEKIIFINSVQTLGSVKRIYQVWWLIGTNVGKESKKFVWTACFNDNSHIFLTAYINSNNIFMKLVELRELQSLDPIQRTKI